MGKTWADLQTLKPDTFREHCQTLKERLADPMREVQRLGQEIEQEPVAWMDVDGNVIEFVSADQPQKIRGRARTYLFCNEANELSYEAWMQLIMRTEGKIVIDEYADMKPQVFEQILRPALSDVKGGALFIGTPKGRNHFYELYQMAQREEDEDWVSFHFTSFDNPLLDPKEIEAAKKSMCLYWASIPPYSCLNVMVFDSLYCSSVSSSRLKYARPK